MPMWKTSKSRQQSNRPIPIRQLAEYTADPKGYRKTKGKIRNAGAVRAGNRGEAALGKTRSSMMPIVGAALIIGLITWMLL